MKIAKRIATVAIAAIALTFSGGLQVRAQQYDYTPPAYIPPTFTSPTPTSPVYNPPTYQTPLYTSPSYYSPTYYNPSCKVDAFSLETDESVLKDMYKNKKCIYLEYDEVPNFDSYHISDCYYKQYGVSCSSVNEDCKYVDVSTLDCKREDGSCEVISEYWNRPMKIEGAVENIPITYSQVDTARDVIVEYADQQHTSVKPVKDRYTFRHNDKEMWWREIYYLCSQGNITDRTLYFNKKKLITNEGGEDWTRGEVGHECKCEARLGYYYYQGDQEYEAEWTLPESSPEKWRKIDK